MLFGGAALALAAGLVVAAIMMFGGHGRTAPPPASQSGLTVQTGPGDDAKLDPKRPLRCFVNGQFVGEMQLDQCASRNGVATGALDVGLDPNGALAAGGGGSPDIAPLPPPEQVAPDQEPEPPTPAPPAAQREALATPRAPVAPCWRYLAGSWQVLPNPMSLGTCVQDLYQGQCERPGAAAYGRWGERTLRLIPGEVQMSRDNHRFSTLAVQGPSCTLPAFG